MRDNNGFDWFEFWFGAMAFAIVLFWLLDKYKVI